jgi:hypothetical protein
MNTHAALRRAGRIEYALWRTPLTIVDEQVIQRFLSEDATVRRSFERMLDSLDEAATRWLSDSKAPSTPASTSSEHPATTDPIQVPQPEHTVEPEPVEKPEESVTPDQVEELAEELLVEEELEPLAGELAENDELRRVQAELNAKRLLAEQHGD